ncbi:carboxypeptidase regulatory-like domain-containing protein [Paludibaculum fermentans]|uniref:carboxypeptidase-like regulatory domain-containing protein n=1 Tax=Paludibaculum fermentans TaxID=1473598 RepID=UPI003EBD133A
MRLLAAALFALSPLYACSCLGIGTPCSAFGGSSMVFVARVLVDSGEGWGNRPARVRIEEKLLNVPENLTEVEIDTSAGTSCYRRLRQGQQYVIFAYKRERKTPQLSIGACSPTFQVEGNEHILDALRNQSRGGAPRLIGTVRRSTSLYSSDGWVAGATITARSQGDKYEAISDAAGHYEIRDIAPGQYQIEISKGGFLPDQDFNLRWSGRLVLNKETNVIGPDKAEPRGSVTIGVRSCQVWDLGMWPHGRISGIVRNAAGDPLSGVTVQSFSFNEKGERESRPLRTAKTDDRGRYQIEPLPAGDYVIGVNAEKYRDADPFPPTVFGDQGSTKETRIPLAFGGDVADINPTLQAKRTSTTLRIRILSPEGTPYSGAGALLKNQNGVERWFSTEHTSTDGTLEAPVYLGEQYEVEAFASERNRRNGSIDSLSGSAHLYVSIPDPKVSIVLTLKTN